MDEPIISWSAKELLERMDGRLGSIEGRLMTLESQDRVRRNYRADLWQFLAGGAALLSALAMIFTVLHG